MARKIQRIEPCLHCWAYYQRKVDGRRKSKLPCSQLENKMWDYSMHAAFPISYPCGGEPPLAREKRERRNAQRRLSSRRRTSPYPLSGSECFVDK